MVVHDAHPIATKIAIGIAGGVLAWGGANISSNSKTNAVQDEKIETIESQLEKIDSIYENVNEIRIDVAVIEERSRNLTPPSLNGEHHE